jgi:hypothetical protein
MHENTQCVDFSDCFDSNFKPPRQKRNNLTNTIDYYTKECEEYGQNHEFMDTFEKITCFTLDRMLSEEECKTLIDTSECQGYKDLQSYRKEYRGNQRVVLYDPKSAKILFERVKKYLPKTVVECSGNVWTLKELNPMIRFGKYNPDDAFAAHKDSGFNELGTKAMLTVMFYLSTVDNSQQVGGRTRMLTLNKTCRKSEDENCEILDMVEPKEGKCIIFNQYSIYHDGEKVKEGLKYIMRTDIMYLLE